MAIWQTPIIWPNQPVAITTKHLQLINDDLSYLKVTLELLKTNSQQFSPAPTLRDATFLSGTVWTISRGYLPGKIQVFVDGLLQREGTDWSESASPSSGQINFTSNPLAGSIVQVLDWTK